MQGFAILIFALFLLPTITGSFDTCPFPITIFLYLSISWISLVLFPLVTVHDSEISFSIYDLNPYLKTVLKRLSLRYGKQKLKSRNWSSVLIINVVQVRKCLSGEHENGRLVFPLYFCFIRFYFHAWGVTYFMIVYIRVYHFAFGFCFLHSTLKLDRKKYNFCLD